MDNIKTLSKAHNRLEFDCGNAVLNHYLKTQAAQGDMKNITRTFVYENPKHPESILGFYTISLAEIEAPSVSRLKTPHPIPTMRIARLAVDKRCQGQGLGGELLIDAIVKIAEAYLHVPFVGIGVDAKDEIAKSFYKHYGFIEAEKGVDDMFLWMSVKIALEIHKTYLAK